MFNKELDNAKKIYDKQMWLEKNKDDSAPISKNMPQVAGNLQWAHEIRQRVAVPIASLRQLDHQWGKFVLLNLYLFQYAHPPIVSLSLKWIYEYILVKVLCIPKFFHGICCANDHFLLLYF